MATPSRIADFYAGKSVFITGATGLIGKVLLERLLQTCPEICKIYVLVRNKHGVNERRRVEKLVKCQAFDHIRRTSPETLNKIEAIPGDLTAPELGISPNDQETLMKNVSIVFHSAATVRFDEPLKSSVQMNVVGTLSVINLCKRLRDLKAIVHISTAYCNCEHSFIEERIYPTSHDYEDIVQSSRWMTADEMDAIFPQLKGAKPNTYAYTKSLAEQMIGRVGAGLPIAILRPTVVGNSCKEPFPGWVDSANGGGGLLTALANGAWRFSRTSKTSLADLVPVDYCANAMIVLGWRSGTTW
ncbi:unnamed protein product [Notodromas monacha]|uniref:Fatty acyl-CoA reductase n=1 Tax=Notodromas monacha TaxID=399045 RepID=A0A7R9BY43_9CRUS|nr:unnamed protein product [Notodromas monacha]CAG0922801.1 unnamed protein product [Notodromas monacha]